MSTPNVPVAAVPIPADDSVVVSPLQSLRVQANELLRQLTEHQADRYGHDALTVIRHFVKGVKDGTFLLQLINVTNVLDGVCYRIVVPLNEHAYDAASLYEITDLVTGLMQSNGYQLLHPPTAKPGADGYPNLKGYCFRVNVV